MYSNYGINSNTKMSLKNINRLIDKAQERKNENTAWEMWLRKYPLMLTGQIEVQQFKDFKESMLKNTKLYTEISNEEIAEEFDSVVASYKKRGE